MTTFTLVNHEASLSDPQLDLYKKLLEEKVTTFADTCIGVQARVENPDNFDIKTIEVIFSLQDDKLVLDWFESEFDIDADEIDYITAIANEWYRLGGKVQMEELRIRNLAYCK